MFRITAQTADAVGRVSLTNSAQEHRQRTTVGEEARKVRTGDEAAAVDVSDV